MGDRREGDRLVAPRRDLEGERGGRGRREPSPARPRLRRRSLVHVRRARLAGLVRIHRDGGVEVENGVQDIGGGIRTPIAMVVAEELGLPAREDPREDRRLALSVRARLGWLRHDRLAHSGRSRRRRPRAREAPRRRVEAARHAGLGDRARERRLLLEGRIRGIPKGLLRAFPARRSSRRETARRTTTARTRGSSARSSPRWSWTSRPASSA